MKKITEKFENGLLVERITEETPEPVKPLAAGGYLNGVTASSSMRAVLGEANMTADGVR